MLLNVAAVVFAIAALGGIVLAAHVLRGKFAPWALSLLHAALGAAGIVLVLVTVIQGLRGNAALALGLFVIAALGGFFLASFHYRKQLPPSAVVVVHAVVALAGFGALLAAIGIF
jgi:hypothetical protein